MFLQKQQQNKAAMLDHGLAFLIIVTLVLISEQRLVVLHLGPGSHGARRGSKNDCDDYKGGNYRHGYDFSQRERLT